MVGNWQVIAAFQIRELVRRRVLWLLLLITALGQSVFAFALYKLRSDPHVPAAVAVQLYERMFSAMLHVGALLAALLALFMAVTALAAEIETGRIQMEVSRPVTRTGVFLGHFAGLAGAVGGYAVLYFLITLLVFGIAGGLWPAGWLAVMLVYPLSPLVMLALALWLGARLSPLAAGLCGLVLLVLAWLGSGLEVVGYLAHLESLQVAGVLSSLLLPMPALVDFVTSTLRDGLGGGLAPVQFQLAPTPSVWMVLYAVVYLGGVVVGAGGVFRRRDL